MALRPAGDDLVALVQSVMRESHQELVADRVGVDVLEAFTPPKPERPRRKKSKRPPKPLRRPLWKDGLPCCGLAKINSPAMRAKGAGECRIEIDVEAFGELTAGQRRGLIDHELRHFLVCCDPEGNTTFDETGRPKVRIRPHDHQVGVFLDVIDRHGWDAPEARGLRAAVEDVKQLSFGWEQVPAAANGAG